MSGAAPMDLAALLAPVSPAAPCGADLAFSSELDAIARARQADDPSIEQGAWVTTLKEADWKFVASACSELLKKRSKDLRLAVWLAEASAKTAGLRGLGDALLLTAGLCEHYWDGLYPLPDEDGHEQRTGNLCWIAARAAQLAREVALTEGARGFSLNDFAFARSHGGAGNDAIPPHAPGEAELDAARRKSAPAFYRRLLEDCGHCETALCELERVVDRHLGQDGPGFSAARASVQDVAHFVTPLAAAADEVAPGGATTPAGTPPRAPSDAGASTDVDAVDGADGTASTDPHEVRQHVSALAREARGSAGIEASGAGAATEGGTPGGALQSRAAALDQLRAVAAFFRRTEPHSPVAYLADKAARWGEQPLHVWLRAVIKDDVQYAQLEEMLGAADPHG